MSQLYLPHVSQEIFIFWNKGLLIKEYYFEIEIYSREDIVREILLGCILDRVFLKKKTVSSK